MAGYTAAKATVQGLLVRGAERVQALPNAHVRTVLHHLSVCRTPALGYHTYRCEEEACGHIHYQYHSCRNRHCPMCGALKKEEWIERRRRELLPVKYYHVVFTLPAALNAVVMGHRRELFDLLFKAAAATLLTFGADERYLGACPGILSVLHTWGQNLSFHPHVHCVVSGGGITKEGVWKEAQKNDWRFLFPVKAMSEVYRGKFIAGLKALLKNGGVTLPEDTVEKAFFEGLYATKWVVYAKAPFGGPEGVLQYLGRYSHKVAISNHRIVSVDEARDTVCFQYKDYRDGARQKQMTLSTTEFIRRFSQHILPKGLVRIRSYGYLANRGREQRMEGVLQTLKLPRHPKVVQVPFSVRLRERYGMDVNVCPVCGRRTLHLVAVRYPFKGGEDS